MMCGKGRRFARQIDWIQRTLGRARNAEQCHGDQAMPDAARERIRHALQERLKQDDDTHRSYPSQQPTGKPAGHRAGGVVFQRLT
jgi:hypothetical protein